IVWVKTGADTFEGRLVTTGARSDEFTQIMSGIREGEEVVTSGGYLIDSESQLRTENEPPPSSQQ
ncbi:MAG TPA: efflux transporter periplasmic adaptor subunit, partial [Bacteroidota bacterium]|nr:efflux transporter periplasmic adaptor subunit [Bacteroidota bacterium]